MIGLRVAHLLPALQPTGATSNAVNHIRWLRANDHDVVMLTAGGPRRHDVEATGAEIIDFDDSSTGWLIKGRRRLARALADWAPDLLHVHRLDALPLGLKLAAKARIPVVVSVHSALEGEALEPLKDPAVAMVLVPTEAQRAWYCSKGGLDRNRVVVLPYGVDLHRYRTTPAAVSDAPVMVGTIANFAEQREGVLRVVEAIGALREAGLAVKGLVVGRGEGRNEVTTAVVKAGLDDVIAIEEPGPHTAPILERMDIFAYPVARDLHSLVLLKAMASACAVVATAVGGVPELIHDGHSGILIPTGDTGALIEALRGLVEHRERGRELATQARATVEQEHDLDLVGTALHELYRCALRGGTAGATGTETVNTWRRVATGENKDGAA